MVSLSSMATSLRSSAISKPASARTVCIQAETARSSTSPTAVSRAFTAPKGKGSVSVIDFATQKVEATWPIPGGGSPDMGNISIDGKQLWLSGRYDNSVYVIDTTNGNVKSIPVKTEPHGLTVWPQPGRYSLGHTGNLR